MNNQFKDHTRGHNPAAQSCYVHLAASTAHAARPENVHHRVISWLLTLLLLAGISTNFSTLNAQTVTDNCSFTTYTQGGYGSTPQGNNPGTIVERLFPTAFPSGLTIGGGCTGAETLRLTSAAAVRAFLPSGSTARALEQN